MKGRIESGTDQYFLVPDRGDVVESTVSSISRYAGIIILISSCVFVIGLALKILA